MIFAAWKQPFLDPSSAIIIANNAAYSTRRIPHSLCYFFILSLYESLFYSVLIQMP